MTSAESLARSAARRSWTGYAYAGIVVLLWSGFSLAGRYAALSPGVRMTPWDLVAVRYAVAQPIALVAYLAGPGRGLPWRRSAVVAALAGICFPLPAFLGFQFAPAAHAAVILSGCMPFFVTTGLVLLGAERWTRARLQSLAVLLVGLLCLGTAAVLGSARPGAWRGDLLFAAAAIAWAAFTILARRWAVTPWQAVSTIGVWAGSLYLAVWFLVLPSTLSQVAPGLIAFQAVMQGLLTTVVSVIMFTRALTLLGPERLSLVTALVPGVAGAAAAPLLGETVGLLDVAGLALVGLAVAIGVRRPQSP